MSPVQFILNLLLPVDELAIPAEFSIYYTLDGESVGIGDILHVPTLFDGIQPARVDRIVENPYWGKSGFCAYVIGDGFTEYVPLEMEAYEC